MPSPQKEKELENQLGLPPIGDLGSFFPDPDCSYNFEAERGTTNVDANESRSNYNLNIHLAHVPKQDSQTDPVGDDMSNKPESATIPRPPPSRSNPETPKENVNYSQGNSPPEMARFYSEQSGLPSLSPGHLDHPHIAQQDYFHRSIIKPQRPSQQPPSISMRRPDNSEWGQPMEAIASSADSNISMQARSYNPHQGGLDLGAQHGYGGRPSHLRTSNRQSGLRNIVSANPVSTQGADIYSSLPHSIQPNQHFMQPMADTSNAQENFHAFRSRRHTDSSMSGRNLPMQQFSILDQGQVFGGYAGSPDYAGPARSYSPGYAPGSVSYPYVPGGQFVHPNVDSPQNVNRALFQHPMTTSTSPYNLSPHQSSAFGNRMHPTMKREDLSSDSSPQRVSYQSVEQAEGSQGAPDRSPEETSSGPKTAEEKKKYIKKILDAMYDTSKAEDNAGMISAWKTQMNDKEAVEAVARDLLDVCERREALGKPFRKGLKPSQRYRNFDERFDALMKALTTQKTMCKHLLRQPYIEEIVDDPAGSVSRISNNRKVNKGKKLAIEKGREALGQEGKSRRSIKTTSRRDTDDEQDADNESFDEQQEHWLKRPFAAMHESGSPGGSHDPSYGEGPAPKRTKRRGSRYQINCRNEMIDTLEPEPVQSTHHNRNTTLVTPRRRGDEHGHQQQPDYTMSHSRLRFESPGPSEFSAQSVSDAQYSQPENDETQHAGYQPASSSRTRRRAHR